jgi:hypothetical protein
LYGFVHDGEKLIVEEHRLWVFFEKHIQTFPSVGLVHQVKILEHIFEKAGSHIQRGRLPPASRRAINDRAFRMNNALLIMLY